MHTAMSRAPAVLERLELRGRREGHSVVLFSTAGGPQSVSATGAPVLPIRQAVEALREVLDSSRLAAGG